MKSELSASAPGVPLGVPELAVILAAGRGSRLSSRRRGTPKPLVRLLGLSLIERAMVTCAEAGVRKFVVVLGYRAGEVRNHLEAVAARRGYQVEYVIAPDWPVGNGASARAAAQKAGRGPFLLMMADHAVEAALLDRLLQAPLRQGEVCLAVDRNKQAVPDPKDVTKVVLSGQRILEIGKNLERWDAADTGVFLCTTALFTALEQTRAATLSEAMNWLARQGRLRAADVTGSRWVDVDTPATHREARRRLLAGLGKGNEDGFIAQYINRPVSTRISAVLASTPATPNHVTVASFLLCAIGAALLALGAGAAILAGAVLVQFGSIVDGCDGEIARLKHLASPRGAWLDTMLDRYADILVALAITYSYASAEPAAWVWMAGFLAAWGFTLASYVTKEFILRCGFSYPNDLLNRLKRRDLRLFVIAAGAAAGAGFETLLAMGLLSHACIIGIVIRGWSVTSQLPRSRVLATARPRTLPSPGGAPAVLPGADMPPLNPPVTSYTGSGTSSTPAEAARPDADAATISHRK